MNLNKLTDLKERIETGKDLSDAWVYFFDNFGEDPAFSQLGGLARNTENLETVIAQIGQEIFQTDVALSQTIFTELPEQQFIHGVCFINGHMANILYFRDIDMGTVAIVTENSEMMFARFACIPLQGSIPVFVNMRGNDIMH